tara:strand:- start:2034 stop:2243 length:210 start_codon:yes stop_codon:yes gene_type:complete
MDKKKITEQAGKLIKIAQREGKTAAKASKPIAKKWLGKISSGIVALGEKGQQAASEMKTDEERKDPESS